MNNKREKQLGHQILFLPMDFSYTEQFSRILELAQFGCTNIYISQFLMMALGLT